MDIFSAVLLFVKQVPARVWLALVVVLSVVLLWFYIQGLRQDITDLKGVVSNMEAEAIVIKAEKSALQISLVDQNSAIDKLSKAGKKLQDEIDRLHRESVSASIEYGAAQEALRLAKIPAECEQVMVWHGQQMRKFELKYGKTK